MNGRIVHVRSLSPDDEAAWTALGARAAEPNPLYEPNCLVPAARHQTFGDEIHVVFAEEGGRIYGCMPSAGCGTGATSPTRSSSPRSAG